MCQKITQNRNELLRFDQEGVVTTQIDSIENYGVDPTIPLDNLPHEEIAGRDPQLEKAVEVLLQKIEDEPVNVPTHGDFPKRDK